jgi:predicted permease
VAPEGIPRLADIRLDARVLLFSLGVSLATGAVFGIAPLLHTGIRRMGLALREGGQRTTAGAAQRRIQRGLVVSELALAVTLVVGAGLMLRSFDALRRTDPGFDPENLLTLQVFLPAAQYAAGPELTTATNRLLDAMRAVPGVTSVAAMTGLPPLRNVNANDTEFEGLQPPPDGPPQNVDFYQFVSTDYFTTMGIDIASGRSFESIDHAGSAGVVLINERLAEVFYPGTDPIGRRLRPPGPPDAPWFTIVGVVKDVKQGGIEAATGTELYVHLPQFPARSLNFVIRTSGDPTSLLPAVTAAVKRVDPTLPVGMPRTMEEVVGRSLARPRFLTILLACFAVIALGLAAVGTYGVMAFTVAQRTQEVGVRMALGGQPSSVVRLVFRQSFVVALIGIAVGVAGALALTRLMQGLLYGISATDVWSYLVAVAVLGTVAGAACLIPSVRAARVDPAQALRE